MMTTTNEDTASHPSHQDDAGNLCVPCMIDSQTVLQPSSASFPVTSAKLEKIVHYGQTATIVIATQAVDSAAKAFRTYKKTPVHERRRMLLKAADLFETRSADAVRRQMLETSCDEGWAKAICMQTATFIRSVASHIEQAVTGHLPPSQFDFTTLVYREPVGTVLLIPP